MIIDRARHAVIVNGQAHRPPRRVYDLIEALSSHPGMVWSREKLMDRLGIADWASDRAVDSTVKRARQFLRQCGLNNCIFALYHEGYYWKDEE